MGTVQVGFPCKQEQLILACALKIVWHSSSTTLAQISISSDEGPVDTEHSTKSPTAAHVVGLLLVFMQNLPQYSKVAALQGLLVWQYTTELRIAAVIVMIRDLYMKMMMK